MRLGYLLNFGHVAMKCGAIRTVTALLEKKKSFLAFFASLGD
jgi:hypothetical protein